MNILIPMILKWGTRMGGFQTPVDVNLCITLVGRLQTAPVAH